MVPYTTFDNNSRRYPDALIEIGHLWQEQSLDPRRPVLFIAWGTGTQGFAGVDEFLTDNNIFWF